MTRMKTSTRSGVHVILKVCLSVYKNLMLIVIGLGTTRPTTRTPGHDDEDGDIERSAHRTSVTQGMCMYLSVNLYILLLV
jgi:hypothetical protein